MADEHKKKHLSSIRSRFIVPLIVTTTLISGAVFLLSPYAIDRFATHIAKDRGSETINQVQAIRHYYNQFILPKARLAGLEIDVNHKNNDNALPPPATFLHDIGEVVTGTGVSLKLYSPYPWPNRRDRVLTDFERNAWDILSTAPQDTVATIDTISGKPIVRVAKADVFTRQSCVDCHNTNPDSPIGGWSLGQTRGVVEVQVDISNFLSESLLLSNAIVGSFGLFAAILLVSSWFAGSSITSPLLKLKEATLEIVQGNLQTLVPGTQRTDELGEMSKAIEILKNTMVERNQLSEREKEADKETKQRAENIQGIAKKFDNNITESFSSISTAVEKMYASSNTLFNDAKDTSEKTNQMLDSIKQAGENINAVSSAGTELSNSINEIVTLVEGSRNIASAAAEQAGTTNERVRGLAEAAQRIGEVVNLINDIANQTNLLALNATIEAARAGEAGRGFAVVANEVKNLASQTAKATEDISTQIQAVQKETQQAVDAIRKISEITNQINEISGQVADSVELQSSASREISHNAIETAVATRKVTEGLNGLAEAANRTGIMAEALFHDTETLRKQADSMGGEIINFLEGVKES